MSIGQVDHPPNLLNLNAANLANTAFCCERNQIHYPDTDEQKL